MRKEALYLCFIVAVTGGCLASCSTQNRLEETFKKSGLVNIRQPKRNEKQADTTAVKNKIYSFKDKNGKEQYLVDSSVDEKTGESIASYQLGEVEVVAKSKTVPERNGMITIPFVINVPQYYAQKDWRITVYPTLNNEGKKIELKPIAIAGTDFRAWDKRRNFIKKQKMKNNIRLEEKLLKRRKSFYPYFYRNDSTVEIKEQELQVWMQRKEDADKAWQLDTIIKSDQAFSYYYKQELPTEGMSGKIKLMFTAKVEDLNDETFQLQEGDTLNYFLSSMTQFLDRTPRYVRETILRKATEKESAYIHFPVGSTQVQDTLHNNREELAKVAKKMKEINEGNEFIVDSIVLYSTCSPEGTFATNEKLAKDRALSLKNYLEPIISTNAEAVELVKAKHTGENWEKLLELLPEYSLLNQEGIIEIIKTVKDPDERERKIANLYPADYERMKKEIYPKLRAVDFVFHLSRRGMVEDVMYTDVIDVAYAEALKLMDERKYKEAMPKLLEYRDWNTAICYMSLGYNGTAVNILLEQKETADREYLLAILYARLHMEETAIKLYLKSCEMDDSKIERGELDPEIAKLIREHNLTSQLYKL